ncbi:4Fe-4S dicluster domain-containing protein [Pontiella agarivorans]|uniref:4Fe-4S binding protein n=1 Tax=Pontiella agarivorans TaxID=3038953 RepID=A0ABU5MW27_9BACT|nr:4Fe-4S binding protein [Pontiella agarivorans]MDZ8118322.1 4Fe-4S binding protein [Pontiella agarivorans]
MAIERIDGCIGCGTCVSACPTDVLRLNEKNGKAEIKYLQECQVCYLCQQYCPVDAITITDGRVIPSVTAWG